MRRVGPPVSATDNVGTRAWHQRSIARYADFPSFAFAARGTSPLVTGGRDERTVHGNPTKSYYALSE